MPTYYMLTSFKQISNNYILLKLQEKKGAFYFNFKNPLTVSKSSREYNKYIQ